MFAIVLFAIVVCASAAPYRGHHHHNYRYHDDMSLEQFMDREIFDTRRFWEELRRDMMGIEAMLADFSRRFPSTISDERIEGNEYKVKILLTGYDEKDITVKARKGLLIIQAVHKLDGGSQRNYLDVRTLPECVNENGSWTYSNNELIVTFSLNKNSGGEGITEAPATQAPVHSREDMDNNPTDGNRDADVGAGRGDTDLSTNEIAGQQQQVEATTYAVDLKDDVELVPIKY